MNILDICILIVVIWLAFKGFKKGFIVELSSLIALVLGVYGAIHFSSILNPIVADLGVSEKYVSIVSFAATFLLIILAVYLIAKLIEKLIDLLALSFLNKIGGGLFGAIKALLVCTIVVVLLNKIDQRVNFISSEFKANSIFFNPMIGFAEDIFPDIMNEYFPVDES